MVNCWHELDEVKPDSSPFLAGHFYLSTSLRQEHNKVHFAKSQKKQEKVAKGKPARPLVTWSARRPLLTLTSATKCRVHQSLSLHRSAEVSTPAEVTRLLGHLPCFALALHAWECGWAAVRVSGRPPSTSRGLPRTVPATRRPLPPPPAPPMAWTRPPGASAWPAGGARTPAGWTPSGCTAGEAPGDTGSPTRAATAAQEETASSRWRRSAGQSRWSAPACTPSSRMSSRATPPSRGCSAKTGRGHQRPDTGGGRER